MATYIINDFSPNVIGRSWSTGTYSACSDSHGNFGTPQGMLDFHHDNASNKGGVNATYSLRELGVDACYKVFEWHPGGDSSCSWYLPHNAPVTIRHASGETHLSVNQGKNGRQWNLLGLFYFQEGQGEIFVSNEGTDYCSASSCYWVADAFKLVQVEGSNSSCPPLMSPSPSSPPPYSPGTAHSRLSAKYGATFQVPIELTVVFGLGMVCAICVCVGIWWRLQRCMVVTARDMKMEQAAAVSSAIAALPTHSCAASECGECAICVSDFNEKEMVKTLPCGHMYHADCIDQWLMGRCAIPEAQPSDATCPLCKTIVLLPGWSPTPTAIPTQEEMPPMVEQGVEHVAAALGGTPPRDVGGDSRTLTLDQVELAEAVAPESSSAVATVPV